MAGSPVKVRIPQPAARGRFRLPGAQRCTGPQLRPAGPRGSAAVCSLTVRCDRLGDRFAAHTEPVDEPFRLPQILSCRGEGRDAVSEAVYELFAEFLARSITLRAGNDSRLAVSMRLWSDAAL